MVINFNQNANFHSSLDMKGKSEPLQLDLSDALRFCHQNIQFILKNDITDIYNESDDF